MDYHAEFLLNEKDGLSFEENIFKIINKYYVNILEKTNNWKYICSFLTEDVLKEFIHSTVCDCRLNKEHTKNNINYIINQIFSNIQYAGLPTRSEYYYLNK